MQEWLTKMKSQKQIWLGLVAMFLQIILKNFLQSVKKISGHLQFQIQKMMTLKFLQNLKTINL
ncbi:MAG: hypothetical protein E7059_11200 [Treponema bryantii]|nr:hypothetical protein [Treponema bryantii]MBR6583446.1 hypothetical protein [Treponema sp.]